jgi:archaellum component FlaC
MKTIYEIVDRHFLYGDEQREFCAWAFGIEDIENESDISLLESWNYHRYVHEPKFDGDDYLCESVLNMIHTWHVSRGEASETFDKPNSIYKNNGYNTGVKRAVNMQKVDPMEKRIEALENGLKAMDESIDKLDKEVTHQTSTLHNFHSRYRETCEGLSKRIHNQFQNILRLDDAQKDMKKKVDDITRLLRTQFPIAVQHFEI